VFSQAMDVRAKLGPAQPNSELSFAQPTHLLSYHILWWLINSQSIINNRPSWRTKFS